MHAFITSYKTAARVHGVRLLLERACHPDHQSADPKEFGMGVDVGALGDLLAKLQRLLINRNNRLRAAYQTYKRLTLLQGRTLMQCVLAMRQTLSLAADHDDSPAPLLPFVSQLFGCAVVADMPNGLPPVRFRCKSSFWNALFARMP